MGSAILRDTHVDHRRRSRLVVDPPRRGDRAAPAEGDATGRSDVLRLGAAVIGLALYVGVPLAGIAWLAQAFMSRITADG